MDQQFENLSSTCNGTAEKEVFSKEAEKERSNKCSQCDYASSYAHDLRTHLKTHSGEKPYKCNQCNYASSQEGNL